MVYNGNKRDKYKKKSIYQKEIMKGQIETDKKKPMMKGQKGKKSPILKRNRDIRKK